MAGCAYEYRGALRYYNKQRTSLRPRIESLHLVRINTEGLLSVYFSLVYVKGWEAKGDQNVGFTMDFSGLNFFKSPRRVREWFDIC